MCQWITAFAAKKPLERGASGASWERGKRCGLFDDVDRAVVGARSCKTTFLFSDRWKLKTHPFFFDKEKEFGLFGLSGFYGFYG